MSMLSQLPAHIAAEPPAKKEHFVGLANIDGVIAFESSVPHDVVNGGIARQPGLSNDEHLNDVTRAVWEMEAKKYVTNDFATRSVEQGSTTRFLRNPLRAKQRREKERVPMV